MLVRVCLTGLAAMSLMAGCQRGVIVESAGSGSGLSDVSIPLPDKAYLEKIFGGEQCPALSLNQQALPALDELTPIINADENPMVVMACDIAAVLLSKATVEILPVGDDATCNADDNKLELTTVSRDSEIKATFKKGCTYNVKLAVGHEVVDDFIAMYTTGPEGQNFSIDANDPNDSVEWTVALGTTPEAETIGFPKGTIKAEGDEDTNATVNPDLQVDPQDGEGDAEGGEGEEGGNGGDEGEDGGLGLLKLPANWDGLTPVTSDSRWALTVTSPSRG